MKVLLLAPVPPPDHGGIINWTRLVKAEFAKHSGYKLRFVDSAARYREVTNHSSLLRLIFGSAQALRDCVRVLRQFLLFRPDVFHICTSGGPATIKDAILVTLARVFRIPTAVHYRMGRLPHILASDGIECRLTRYVLKRSAMVLVLGKRSEAIVRHSAPGQRVIDLPNMVDMGELGAVRSEIVREVNATQKRRITFIGHTVPKKGIKELVQACAALQPDQLELHLVGPCSAAFQSILLKETTRGGGRVTWLRFHGAVTHHEALRQLALSDLFVLPSYTEGAPNVILEAMGMGKPILATSVGAVPEMLAIDTEKPCGVCIAPHSTAALGKAVQDYLSHPSKWASWASNARLRAQEVFATPIGCDHLRDVWQAISRR